MKEQAISLLDTIDKQKQKYDEINKKLRKLQGEFSTHIQDMDTDIESGIVDLLDTVLGYKLASYYLYDCYSTGKRQGWIKEYGVKYPIQDIEDVRKFVFREVKDGKDA